MTVTFRIPKWKTKKFGVDNTERTSRLLTGPGHARATFVVMKARADDARGGELEQILRRGGS